MQHNNSVTIFSSGWKTAFLLIALKKHCIITVHLL